MKKEEDLTWLIALPEEEIKEEIDLRRQLLSQTLGNELWEKVRKQLKAEVEAIERLLRWRESGPKNSDLVDPDSETRAIAKSVKEFLKYRRRS